MLALRSLVGDFSLVLQRKSPRVFHVTFPPINREHEELKRVDLLVLIFSCSMTSLFVFLNQVH